MLGRPADAIRQAMMRVREKLRECIERRLSSRGAL
jgi:DNA-directed RNA polymerase specialized sigma24 family protein